MMIILSSFIQVYKVSTNFCNSPIIWLALIADLRNRHDQQADDWRDCKKFVEDFVDLMKLDKMIIMGNLWAATWPSCTP